MDAISAQRTLVKSPPELWSRLSDAEALAGHLGEFGEIRITRLEAERTVVWEGDRARGTVELEPSGWGTKVTLTAEPEPEPEPEAEPQAKADPEPDADSEPDADPKPERPSALELTVESTALEPPLPDRAPDYEPEPRPDSALAPSSEPPRKPGFLARLFGRRRPAEATRAQPTDESRAEEAPPTDEALGPAATVAGRRALAQDPPAPGEDAPEPVDTGAQAAEAEAQPVAPDVGALEASQAEAEKTASILETVLDDLGAAHHRPFSRG